MKKLPIEVEDFKELIDNNYYYVDNSIFIGEVLRGKVSIYTQPSKFGKTLNQSMLYYFLSNKEKENAYLFNGLLIEKFEWAMQHQNKYPVIFISLKDLTYNTMEQQQLAYSKLMIETINSFEELLDETRINKYHLRDLKKIREGSTDIIDLESAIDTIMDCLQDYYHEDVMVLIDDYDIPLQAAFLNGYYKEMADFLSSIFSVTFKGNNKLANGVLTGVTCVPPAGIFSGFNNYVLNSFLSGRFNDFFGFIQEEIDELLKEYHLELFRDEIKKWYGGYKVGENEIYNPYSVLSFINQASKNKFIADLHKIDENTIDI